MTMRRKSAVSVLALALALSSAWAQSAPQQFKLKPLRPVAELRREALAATPPVESGDFLTADLVELTRLDATMRLDIHYASNENFLGEPLYTQARAFLQRPAAEALVRVNQRLHQQGLGLLIFDAYRPWYVTRIFWEATPPSLHEFVAKPKQGSRHNRGCAVDLTLFDLKTGQPLPMPSGYDEMSERANSNYTGDTDTERANRDRLRRAMEVEGFTIFTDEWWHFDYKDWRRYRILNVPFEKL